MLGLRRAAHRHVITTTWRAASTKRTTQTARLAAQARPAQPATPQRNDGINSMSRSQQLGLYGALGVALIMSFYAAQVATALSKASTIGEGGPNLAEQKDVVARYDEIANSFDSDVNFSEWLMGILKIRKFLAGLCQGNVLEVSCGTGRNLGYFDFDEAMNGEQGVKSLTFIDVSEPMVQVCRRKWAALHGIRSLQTGYWKQRPIRFIACSALDDMPLAPDGRKYDTVLQTMGLCSTPEPEELLRNLAKHLNTSNPDARILLLEHGRSTQNWLNNVLDNTAEKHAENYGCWYNRDIDGIVKRAAQAAGLELTDAKRSHLGTTFIYELKVAGQTPVQSSKQDEQAPRGSILQRAACYLRDYLAESDMTACSLHKTALLLGDRPTNAQQCHEKIEKLRQHRIVPDEL